MESSRFLASCADLSAALFNTGDLPALQNNRLFCLQAGESLTLKTGANPTYLYLLKGRLSVAQDKREAQLDESSNNSQRIFSLPVEGDYACVTAQQDCVFNHVDARRLDDLITWVNIAKILEPEPEKLGVLSKVMVTKSLSNMPVESVFSLISRMRLRQVRAGEVIVEQGQQAEHFYILHEGHAEVWSMGLYDDSQQHVNTLGEGDSFGEDALVTGGTRNATIKMQTDGVILEGDKKDFLELIAKPVIEEVDIELVSVLKERDNYQLLDVRYEEEHEEGHLDGCHLIPLHELRGRLDELDPARQYIT
ncbi:MAG TPA: cyclic nucleotide-binding domain-containing protein, partial [Gammaproteobacteria bacterium]|nr:cyclic nucleotide-binding domain-containing protein [Gammaproteobacteria bacterium]